MQTLTWCIGGQNLQVTRPTLKSVTNSSSNRVHDAETGVDPFTKMSNYGRGESHVALSTPVRHMQSRHSTSATASLPPNTAHASDRSSYNDQTAPFPNLLQLPCATLDVSCPRGVITDASYPQSPEPSHELSEFELRSGSTSGSGVDLPLRNQPKLKKEQIFACLYCERAFGQPHDFKRHFKDSHESEHSYVCDGDNCSLKYRLADKFRAHHKKSHHCGKVREKCQHAEKCRRPNSDQKARRGCGFCLHCSDSLDNWLNHVANHYKNKRFKKKDWSDAMVFSSLLSQPKLVEAWGTLTSNPFPHAGWSNNDRERLQSCMERGVMTPEELVQDIYTTFYGNTTRNAMQPLRQMQPPKEGLQLKPSILYMGNMEIPSFSPHIHNVPSPLNDQSNITTFPQTSHSANQAFDMPHDVGDDMALNEWLEQDQGFTNHGYGTRDLGHSYTEGASKSYQTDATTEQQYYLSLFAYPSSKSVI